MSFLGAIVALLWALIPTAIVLLALYFVIKKAVKDAIRESNDSNPPKL